MRKILLTVLALAALTSSGARPAWACVSDDDCTPSAPICDLDICVECLLDFDCPSPGEPRCEFSTNSCEACASDANCTSFAGLPFCHPSGSCVQCSASSPAACTGNTPVCDTATGACVPCASNSDCIANPDGEVCSGAGSCGSDPGNCSPAPLESCLVAGYSTIRISAPGNTKRDRIQWNWLDGSTDAADFGDPTTTSVYTLCLYRDGELLYAGDMPPSFDRWKWTGRGFRYRDRGNADGLQKMKIRVGEGDARIDVKGKGVLFDPPELPIDARPVVVQLVGSGPVVTSCWSANFANPYDRDSFTEFRDREIQ